LYLATLTRAAGASAQATERHFWERTWPPDATTGQSGGPVSQAD